MPKINPNGMHDWDGSPKNLPPQDELFVYKNNVYYWQPCTCSNKLCDRPLIFTENGEKDYGLTMIARGDNHGFMEADILEKLGYSREEIQQALNTEGPEEIFKMIESKIMLDPEGTREVMEKFLDELMSQTLDQLGDMLDLLSRKSDSGPDIGGFTGFNPGRDFRTQGPFSSN